MKAILLAAGVGTRIARELQRPKSCLEVSGKPIIRHTVELLGDNGISATVVVGYEKNTIFDALSGLDVKYFFNPFYKVTNSIGSLWFAREQLTGEEDLLIGNADVFFEQSILDIATDGREPRIMLADKTRVEVGDYFVKTVDGKLTAYGKELTLPERSAEYVGMACIRREAVCDFAANLATLVEQGRYDLWWENALYEFCREKPVYIKDVEGKFWGEIDYIEDYERILAYLDSKKQ
jgi:choline kinase